MFPSCCSDFRNNDPRRETWSGAEDAFRRVVEQVVMATEEQLEGLDWT